MRYGFKEWVKHQPCENCGAYGCDPDHNPTRGSRANLDHDLVIPLCRECHSLKGNVGDKTFARDCLKRDYQDIIFRLFGSYAFDVMQGKLKKW
jgi:hypothetical protein